jgi:outer membrane protein assembly factor BamB
LGGIAATDELVVVGGRDLLDQSDLFFCFDAESGDELWRYQYPANPPLDFADARNGKLDYGNSPRATPAIASGKVVLLGAMGDLNCLDLHSGERLWSLNLRLDFAGALPTWGYVGSPLVVNDRIFVQTGGTDPALVALDLNTGDVIWEAAGEKPGYASLIWATIGAAQQLVGFDVEGAGGWDPRDGRRLWQLEPQRAGEFLVPTPVLSANGLLLVGEANGARLHAWNDQGTVMASPVASFAELAPDCHTPVRVGDFFVGVHGRLLSLDARTLALRGVDEDPDLGDYAATISDGQSKTLTLTVAGDLFLHRYVDGQPEQLAKRRIMDERVEIYAHPAIVGDRLYCRIGKRLVCFDLYE